MTEAEAAFRIQKNDLRIRPIWHQKEDRVLAHILVCFLGCVLWKTLAQFCERAGLGSGRYSFEFTPPTGLAFAPHAVEVRRSLDGAALAFSSNAVRMPLQPDFARLAVQT